MGYLDGTSSGIGGTAILAIVLVAVAVGFVFGIRALRRRSR